MTITSGMTSSNKQDWETPWDFINALPVRFNLDACAYDNNAKATNYWTEQDNALIQEWHGYVWMNPPYANAIPIWLEKAYQESLNPYCDEVWCVVPARTDTKWFHQIATKGKIILLQSRIKFIDVDNPDKINPPFPSVLVIFKRNIDKSIITWDWKREPLNV